MLRRPFMQHNLFFGRELGWSTPHPLPIFVYIQASELRRLAFTHIIVSVDHGGLAHPLAK